jgi:LPXTG-motif cell wall-anchored protein
VTGQAVTITVPAAVPGERVHIWMFSTPTDLGSATVTAARTVTAIIPAGTAAGVHRIVVTDAAGTVLGWTEITVGAAVLASTGDDGAAFAPVALAAVMSVLLGAGLLRRRRSVSLAG